MTAMGDKHIESWPTSEEVGNIVARLAIADNEFLNSMLVAAEKAGDKMLPGDMEKLIGWAKFVQMLCSVISSQKSK